MGVLVAAGCYSAGDDDDNENVSGSGGAGGSGSGGISSGSGGSGGTDSNGGEDATGGNGTTGGKGGTSNSGGSSGSGGSGQAPMDCGDGIVASGEACDDGNEADDDGCSSSCTIEPGYTCSALTCEATENGCALRVPVTFRDFNANASVGGHPDFAPAATNQDVIEGLVEDLLDGEGKPVLMAASATAFIHSVEGFAEWYRDTPGVNATIDGEIVLYDDGAGGYVNRWGANGEQFTPPATYSSVVYGGTIGAGCTECVPAGGQECFDPCPAEGFTSYTCCAIAEDNTLDGNPLFFPIDPPTAGILTDTRSEGKIPPEYGSPGWDWETTFATSMGISTAVPTATAPFPSVNHNFHFTTELKLLFRYDANASPSIAFMGDDDVWVFVNGHLAIDLGGWHPPLAGSVTIDLTVAEEFEMEDGGVYELAVFHAERQVQGSSFRLNLAGFELQSSVCRPN